MRFLAVGLLILALPAVALAQARGQVLTVGFNNHYRPDCWTPMLVQLTSQSADAQTFQIQVVQQDLDHDRVTYTQLETLGGNLEGKPATTENFWVYFKPTPTDGGLPDATDLSESLRTLNERLKVFLCDKDGKQLSTLPLTATILSVDPPRAVGDPSRSRKLILFVSDGTDRPEIADDWQQKGLLQDVDAVTVTPRDLPSNIIGYEGVDAIVWMDADANFLASGTYTPCLEALLQWVRQGGNLVVCQPTEAFKVKPFAEILPVGAQIDGQWTIPMVDRQDMDVLNRLAHPLGNPVSWPKDLGTFKVARVPALAGSKVDEWMQWDDGGATFTPWLARRGDGLGAVTWVAQDLGNADLTRVAKTGWRYVWDRVFDWNNPSDVAEDYQAPAGVDDPWPAANSSLDLGFPLLSGMDLKSTVFRYLAIACFFFVVYWLVAGPGTYLFLAARKQAQLSWFVFGLAAVAATGVTALLVKAVLRGPPELQHVSIVRSAPADGVSVIDSRFGLYIRQDGLKTISLGETAPGQVSYLTPFSLHPQYADINGESAAYQEYQIPVRDASDSGAVSVSIPYRTTSKKLQAHWVGQIKSSIDIAADSEPLKLNAEKNQLVGSLVNHTGYDLWHVFFGYAQPAFGSPTETSSRDADIILYVEKWTKDDTLKLQDLIVQKNFMNLEDLSKRQPMGADPAYGQMGGVQMLTYAWSAFWRGKEAAVSADLDYALPMMTFFDRLPPWQATQRQQRYELYRRSGRVLDLSPALSAGELVICARAMVDNDINRIPLPVPLAVSNEPVSGPGTIIYQFVLPVDRSAVSEPPTTRPGGI